MGNSARPHTHHTRDANAYVINTFDNKPSPPTGQFADRQGRQAALILTRILNNEPTRPFRFKALGQLCSIDGYEAVAEVLGVLVSGFLGWLIWRSVYLFAPERTVAKLANLLKSQFIFLCNQPFVNNLTLEL